MQTLNVKLLRPDAKLPTSAYDGDAGIDYYIPDKLDLAPGERKRVGLGIAIELPAGTVGLMRERSGKGNEGIKVLGGVIDAGYRGEVFAILLNTSAEPRSYEAGTKLVQILVLPYLPVSIQEVDVLETSERGDRGFGSSGDH